MKTKLSFLSAIGIGSALVLGLAIATWLSVAARAADETKEMPMSMKHIQTQAQAAALKPGDSIAMVCSKCKFVMVHTVTTDKSHVKMLTIGEKFKCDHCGGTVEVVGTGKGKGENEEVKYVCSNCGEDAMFACATGPGGGATKDKEKDKK